MPAPRRSTGKDVDKKRIGVADWPRLNRYTVLVMLLVLGLGFVLGTMFATPPPPSPTTDEPNVGHGSVASVTDDPGLRGTTTRHDDTPVKAPPARVPEALPPQDRTQAGNKQQPDEGEKHEPDEPGAKGVPPAEEQPSPAAPPAVPAKGFSAEFTDGEWLITEAKSYEEAAAEIGASKGDGSVSAIEPLRLKAKINLAPGRPFQIALPSRAEDGFRADIAKNGDYYDKGLRKYLTWALYDLIPSLQGDTVSYRSLSPEEFSKAEPGQFLDVGCNAGWASMCALALGARATCVEPNPRLLARLRMSRALAAEDKQSGHLILIPGAAEVTTQAMTMEFPTDIGFGAGFLKPGSSGGDGSSSAAAAPGCKTSPQSPGDKWCFHVPAYRLDEALMGTNTPLGAPPGKLLESLARASLPPSEAEARRAELRSDFGSRGGGGSSSASPGNLESGPMIAMKLDVEGVEVKALRGMAGALATGRIKSIRTEIVPGHLARFGATPEQLLGVLYDAGFRIVFHEARKTPSFAAYACEAGWSVPSVPRSGIDAFLAKGFGQPLKDVNSDMVLLHESAKSGFTPSIAQLLYEGAAIKDVKC